MRHSVAASLLDTAVIYQAQIMLIPQQPTVPIILYN